MLPKDVEQKLQLFVYILQSLRLEERSQEEIMNSLKDYGMNETDIKELWAFYMTLEQQWKAGVKAFLKKGYLNDEIQYQLEGMSEPFFQYLCEQERQKPVKISKGFLCKLSRLFKVRKESRL